MSKAEKYRKRHLEMMQLEAEEESWPSTILNTVAFVASALIWLTLFLVVVPRL